MESSLNQPYTTITDGSLAWICYCHRRGEVGGCCPGQHSVDDGGVVSRGTGESTTVTSLLLDVADDGSLGAGGNREDVSDREGGLLTAVDERTGRDSLGGDESLLAELVAVRVAEDDAGKRGTSTGIVNDLFHDTFDVPVALGKVKSSDAGRVLTVVSVRLENPTGLSLVEND